MKKPYYRLQSRYEDGDKTEPQSYGLEEIDHRMKLSRRGFLALSAVAGALASGCVSTGGTAQDRTSASGQPSTLAHSNRVNSVAYSPDGSKIVTCSRDDTVKIWDAKTGALLKTLIDNPPLENF